MCSLCRLPVAKSHNFGQILTFFGAPVRTPFYRWGLNFVCYSRPTVYVYLRNFVSIGLLCRPVAAKTPNFCRFLDFGIQWCRQLASISESWAPSRVHNYKLSLIQWHQNRFCTPTPSWRNRAHKLWRSKTWRTDKQTDKKLNVFGHPGGGWNPSPTKLDTVIEDLEHVLAPRKLLRVWRIVSPLGGAENLGETRPLNLKHP